MPTGKTTAELIPSRRAVGLREFADSLSLSYDSVWRAATDGRLKTIRFGKRLLIPVAEIERVLSEGLEAHTDQ